MTNQVEGDLRARTRTRVCALEALDLNGLRAVWSDHFGSSTKLRSPELIRLLLAWRIQSAAFGGLDPRIERRVKAKPGAVLPATSLLGGARLVREWRGRRYEVEVTGDGCVWEGRTFRSLSEAAREITGTRWNGPRFFGLRSKAQ